MPGFLAAVTLLCAMVKGFADPMLCWDPWAYHMTFAALLWDIGHARELYYLTGLLHDRFDGFGLAAHWFMGLIWRIFGSPNGLPLVNLLPVMVMIALAKRWLGAPMPLLLFSLLIMPLVSIHITGAFIDLFLGAVLTIAWLGLVRLMQSPDLSYAQRRQTTGARIAFLIGAGLAGNAKLTALPLVGMMVLYALCILGWRSRRSKGLCHLTVLWFIAVGLLASGTAIKNYAMHGNPLYPMAIYNAAGQKILPGNEGRDMTNPGYLPDSIFSRSGYFLLSLTEIDWLIRQPVHYFYSEAEQAGGQIWRYLPARTAGTFGPFIVLEILVLACGFISLKRRHDLPPWTRHALASFLVLAFATSLMQQSHQLRYWLAIPLMLSVLTCALLAYLCREKPRLLYGLQLGAFVLLVVTQLALPLQRTLFPTRWIGYYPADIIARIGPEFVARLKAQGRACIITEGTNAPYDYERFGNCGASFEAYSPIYTQQEYQVELPGDWKTCEMLPPLRP